MNVTVKQVGVRIRRKENTTGDRNSKSPIGLEVQ